MLKIAVQKIKIKFCIISKPISKTLRLWGWTRLYYTIIHTNVCKTHVPKLHLLKHLNAGCKSFFRQKLEHSLFCQTKYKRICKLLILWNLILLFTNFSHHIKNSYISFWTLVCNYTEFCTQKLHIRNITLPCYRHFLRKSTVCHSQQVAQRPFGLARLGLNWLSWESGRHGSSPERAKTNQSAGAKILDRTTLSP